MLNIKWVVACWVRPEKKISLEGYTSTLRQHEMLVSCIQILRRSTHSWSTLECPSYRVINWFNTLSMQRNFMSIKDWNMSIIDVEWMISWILSLALEKKTKLEGYT